MSAVGDPVQNDVANAFGRLVDQLESALDDPRTSARLALVDADIAVAMRGREDLACTLRLRSPKPSVEDGHTRAEITIELSEVALERFWDRPLAMAIFDGEATATGPMRKFLAVYPVLRAKAVGSRATRLRSESE